MQIIGDISDGYLVYCFEHIESGRKYVGATQNMQKRLKGHNKSRSGTKPTFFSNALAKYGFDAFSLTVLGRFKTRKAMYQAEVDFIAALNSIAPHGFNMTKGGDHVALAGEAKEKWLANIKAKWADAEYKESFAARISAITKEAMADPAIKAKHLEACRTKEYRAKQDAARATLKARRLAERQAFELSFVGPRIEATLLKQRLRQERPPKQRPSAPNVALRKQVKCLTTGAVYDGAVVAAAALMPSAPNGGRMISKAARLGTPLHGLRFAYQ